MFPKRGAIALVTTALALILLLSFKTPDSFGNAAAILSHGAAVSGPTASPTIGATSGSNGSTGSTGSTGNSGSTATATPAPTTGTATGTRTITGSTVSMPYGDVAVQITVTNGKVTDVQAVTLPARGHSGQISNYVAPILASEALQAQSANINIISGATYTSEAYAQSLQSALDQAGIGSVAVVG